MITRFMMITIKAIVPSRRFFAPKSGVQDSDFLLDGAKHEQDQSDGCQLPES